MCDIIQSGGIIGGPYVPLEQQLGKPIELVFCNPDLIWRSDFPRPRLGQGAFKEAFQAVYKVQRCLLMTLTQVMLIVCLWPGLDWCALSVHTVRETHGTDVQVRGRRLEGAT